MEVEQMKSRPITDENGKVLNDLELVRVAIKNIDKYEEDTGEAVPIEPMFVKFLREASEACTTNEEFVKYKKKHIANTLPLDDIVANTERRNSKLTKEEAI